MYIYLFVHTYMVAYRIYKHDVSFGPQYDPQSPSEVSKDDDRFG